MVVCQCVNLQYQDQWIVFDVVIVLGNKSLDREQCNELSDYMFSCIVKRWLLKL